MSARTRYDNRDANEHVIVDGLRAAGYEVTRCKAPMLDLFVTGNGRWATLEVKNPTRKQGRSKTKAIGKEACRLGGEWHWLTLKPFMGHHVHMLSHGQARWIAANLDRGPGVIAIVTTLQEALKVLDDPLWQETKT